MVFTLVALPPCCNLMLVLLSAEVLWCRAMSATTTSADSTTTTKSKRPEEAPGRNAPGRDIPAPPQQTRARCC